jgi:glycosyltransferase involved in cell wall biosynthesis
MPIIGRRAKAIITVSEFSKQELIDVFKFSENKIRVISNAVSFRSIEENPQISVPINLNQQYILAVSSIEPRKNFTRLIEGFNKLEDRSIQLYVIGKKHKVFKSGGFNMASDDNIKFTGYISDNELNMMYKNALFLIYPSLYEGFGLPPLEAMSMNCPVIASNIPSIKEVCEDAILYINPYDQQDITSKMTMLIKNNSMREKMKRDGFIQAQKYSWENSAKMVAYLLHQI